MLTNLHSLQYTASGLIDLFGTHPVYGEIPFTADPNDTEAHCRDIYARAIAGEFGPIAPYVPPVKTPEQIQKELTDAVQRHLDDVAKTRGYDGILSACSYAAYPNPFQSEGVAALNWRAAVWVQCYQVLDAVKSGAIEIPTAEQLVAGLPPINW